VASFDGVVAASQVCAALQIGYSWKLGQLCGVEMNKSGIAISSCARGVGGPKHVKQ
jgi:hypothetical protein